MKHSKSNVWHLALITTAIIGLSSCMSNTTEDSKERAEATNEQHSDIDSNKMDAQFLVDAAEIHLEEISLGQLAQQKGGASHVKELGEMMEIEHSKLLADLNALAKTKNISLPTSQSEEGQTIYTQIDKKSGNDFGKEYSDLMVNGHQAAISLFERAATDCTDPEIGAWAEATLPALKKHLEHSLICQHQCEAM